MNDHRPSDAAEAALSALQPAALSPALRDRLRLARPAARPLPLPALPLRSPARRTILRFRWSAAAMVLVLAALAGALSIRSRPVPADRHPPALESARLDAPLPDSDRAGRSRVQPATATLGSRPVFLPVQSNRTLLAFHPVALARRPDEAPHYGMRAVVQEDLTAVGAEIDAALHLRRTREFLLPAGSPVY